MAVFAHIERRFLNGAVKRWMEWQTRQYLSKPELAGDFPKLDLEVFEKYLTDSSRELDL